MDNHLALYYMRLDRITDPLPINGSSALQEQQKLGLDLHCTVPSRVSFVAGQLKLGIAPRPQVRGYHSSHS